MVIVYILVALIVLAGFGYWFLRILADNLEEFELWMEKIHRDIYQRSLQREGWKRTLERFGEPEKTDLVERYEITE